LSEGDVRLLKLFFRISARVAVNNTV